MQKDEIIEALKDKISEIMLDAASTPLSHYELCECLASITTELLTPKRLVWDTLSESGHFYRAPAPLFGTVRVENYGRGFDVLWSVPGYCDKLVAGRFASAESAKEAAQAHVDSAHWANTKLGDML